MAGELSTARLALRPWGERDWELLRRLSADPRVVQYVGDGQPWTDERVEKTSSAIVAHWRTHDFGWWVMGLKDTGEEFGFAALNHPGAETGLEPSEFEIGWWLAPGFWRQGLAAEGATAVRDDAFGRLLAPSVVARLQPANRGSAGVARHIGMSHERDLIGQWGEPVAVYRGPRPT
jgi:RimJ/RimL family protein N-acetyltransferase